MQLNEKPFFTKHLLCLWLSFILPDWCCLILTPSTAVVYFPRQVHGERSLWEDSKWSEAGLSGPVPDPLAHGLQGTFMTALFSPGPKVSTVWPILHDLFLLYCVWKFSNDPTRQNLVWYLVLKQESGHFFSSLPDWCKINRYIHI